MINHNSSLANRLRALSRFVIIALAMFTLSNTAQAQQIVTDPLLNKALMEFEQAFPQFIQAHPELAMGATDNIELKGGKSKVTFDYLQQQGQFQIVYDSLQFSPTMPISANSFIVTLNISSVSLSGDANLAITAKKKNYMLNCPGSSFVIGPVTFTSQVTVSLTNGPSLTDQQVKFDPTMIKTNIPCLRKKGLGQESDLGADDYAGELELVISNDISHALGEIAPQDDGSPSQGTLNKVNAGVNNSATSTNSSVANSATTNTMSNGSAIATNATSSCSGTVSSDAKAVITDLASIATQANANGFTTAINQFISDLNTILPTLSAPAQSTVQKFITDLNNAVADGKISVSEKATLITDLYNIALSAGITSSELMTITNDLANVLATLSGISTTQLNSDLQKLVNDTRSCFKK